MILPCILASLALTLSGIVGCRDKTPPEPLKNASQLNAPRFTIAVPQGTAAMSAVEALYPKAKLIYCQSMTEGYTAVQYGKADAFACDKNLLDYVVVNNDALSMLPESIAQEKIVVGAPLANSNLIARVNSFIRRATRSGILDDMYTRWCLSPNPVMPKIPVPPHPTMTLHVVTEGLNEPMNFYNANHELVGFDIEFVKRLAADLNAKLTLTTMTFDGLLASTISGKADLLVANLNDKPERHAVMALSDPYITTDISFLIRKDRLDVISHDMTHLSDLKGKKIATIIGSLNEQFVKEKVSNTTCVLFQQYADAIPALLSKKIDAIAIDEVLANVFIEKNSDNIRLLDEPLATFDYAYAMPKDKHTLHAEISNTIYALVADGTLATLQHKWLIDDPETAIMAPLPTSGPRGILRYVTDSSTAPFNFVRDGVLVGYEVDLLGTIARRLGYGVTCTAIQFGGLIPAIHSGRYDISGASITVTEERAKSVTFTPAIAQGRSAILIRKKENATNTLAVNTIQDVSGRTVGVLSGSMFGEALSTVVPDHKQLVFNTYTDQVAALLDGKIDAFLADEPSARILMHHQTDVVRLPKIIMPTDYAWILKSSNTTLTDEISKVIRELKKEGFLEKLDDKWFSADETRHTLEPLPRTATRGKLTFATCSEVPPFVFINAHGIVGYDIDVARQVANRLGYEAVFQDVQFNAIFNMVQSNKAAVGLGCMSVTEERKQKFLFTEPNYTGGVVLMTRTTKEQPEATTGAWNALKASFYRTFVKESRWKLIIQGLWLTVLISIAAAVLGTILGFGLCFAGRARRLWIRLPTIAFIRITQGTPIVVSLMILYYIIFGGWAVSPVVIAIIGFAINFAAYVSEMMRTGIDAVDHGQWEAAAALGFGRIKTFIKIIAPQAARTVLPVYKGEFISMVKMTSVVGYIAIHDLTKMSDIIRSRTYEAFFPLIATAILYFIIAYALLFALTAFERHIDPHRRPRIVKGVTVP